jgi:hypothetical protein
MAITEITTNEYGTPVAAGLCDTCGRPYTVVPVPDRDRWHAWTSCLEPDCASYDITRDADLWFEPLADHGQVHREPSPEVDDER